MSGHLTVLHILNKVTKEMLFFLVRVYFLVLVRNTTLFQSDPGSLDEWTELMRWFVSWRHDSVFFYMTYPSSIENEILLVLVFCYGLCSFACGMREDLLVRNTAHDVVCTL